MSAGSNKPSLLVADHAPTRMGIRMALGDDVDICAEAGDARQAVREAERRQPDVCIVGIDIPGGGLSAVRGICRAAPHAGVVVLASTADVEDMLACVRAGAVGYVLGSIDHEPLRRVVHAVLEGEAAVPRSMVLELARELREVSSVGGDGLTPREAQVLGMLRRGQSTAAIAARLAISPVTVRRHISTLAHKRGADRAALAAGGSGASGRRSLNAKRVHPDHCADRLQPGTCAACQLRADTKVPSIVRSERLLPAARARTLLPRSRSKMRSSAGSQH